MTSVHPQSATGDRAAPSSQRGGQRFDFAHLQVGPPRPEWYSAAPLAHFVADSDQLPEDFGGDGCEDLDLPPAALEEARQRRAALVVAATGIIDRGIDDLRELDFGDDGLPDPDQAEESFVFERFPARHRASYDEPFFRNVLVTVVKVAQEDRKSVV